MATEEESWATELADLKIPEAERQKRCATCWRGLSRCFCPGSPPTVAEILREVPLMAAPMKKSA